MLCRHNIFSTLRSIKLPSIYEVRVGFWILVILFHFSLEVSILDCKFCSVLPGVVSFFLPFFSSHFYIRATRSWLHM